ncbi:MAG: lipase [Ilumatobacteraceae bacterium]|nr:lipase [Ilumatobacteraceae bacterium]
MAIELDPQIAALLGAVQIPPIGPDTLAAMRGAGLGTPAPPGEVDRQDHVVDETTGVIVRVHRPSGLTAPAPCVYSIHGGGYVLGDRGMDDLKFERWCTQFGIVGVSVEYRLAPETAYPGPLDDCYAGLQWVVDHHEELGIDPTQIGITGVSAGGGLAAALGLLARDRGEIALRFQLLDCPMLDDRQTTHSSRSEGLIIWSGESNTFGWRAYLGARYGTDDIPYLAAPARATDLSGLPPTYVCVGGADGFRDEDIEYALRLGQAGVPTELHVYPGAPHGVAMFVGTDIAERYTSDATAWLGRQLAAIRATVAA